MKVVLQGYVQETNDGEAMNIVRVGRDVAADELEFVNNRFVYCVYAFADRPIGPEDLNAIALEQIEGTADAKYWHRYSEITGYLWTDEEGKIGSHDFLEILRNNMGKFACIIVQEEPVDIFELASGRTS